VFTVTITNISDKQLGPLVALIGTKRYKVRLTHNSEDQAAPEAAPVRGQMKNGTFLSLTGKNATKGSMRESVLKTMERLEKKHGIGNVNRGMLKEKLVEKDLDTQILYQLIREGYLKKR